MIVITIPKSVIITKAIIVVIITVIVLTIAIVVAIRSNYYITFSVFLFVKKCLFILCLVLRLPVAFIEFDKQFQILGATFSNQLVDPILTLEHSFLN